MKQGFFVHKISLMVGYQEIKQENILAQRVVVVIYLVYLFLIVNY